MNKVESPCVRNCCLNSEDICVGCLRSLDEIKEWSLVSDEVKTEIVERIKLRKSELN